MRIVDRYRQWSLRRTIDGWDDREGPGSLDAWAASHPTTWGLVNALLWAGVVTIFLLTGPDAFNVVVVVVAVIATTFAFVNGRTWHRALEVRDVLAPQPTPPPPLGAEEAPAGPAVPAGASEDVAPASAPEPVEVIAPGATFSTNVAPGDVPNPAEVAEPGATAYFRRGRMRPLAS